MSIHTRIDEACTTSIQYCGPLSSTLRTMKQQTELSISGRQFEVVGKDWKVHSTIFSSYPQLHPIQFSFYFAESRSPKCALIPVLMQRCNVFLSFSASPHPIHATSNESPLLYVQHVLFILHSMIFLMFIMVIIIIYVALIKFPSTQSLVKRTLTTLFHLLVLLPRPVYSLAR